jgi:hypothetical protein
MAPKLSGYVGILFLHQRCACHIINLIVNSALDVIKKYLEAFRTAIYFINSSNQRIAAFKRYCIAVNVRPRKFGLDMDVRWNSTYLMLKHLVPYNQTFSVFIETNYPRGEDQRGVAPSIELGDGGDPHMHQGLGGYRSKASGTSGGQRAGSLF